MSDAKKLLVYYCIYLYIQLHKTQRERERKESAQDYDENGGGRDRSGDWLPSALSGVGGRAARALIPLNQEVPQLDGRRALTAV